MPRYRYRWEIVPRPITRRLARDLRLEGQPVQALQSRYGMRPTVDLVRDAWPTLRDFWLARDTVARRALVAELRQQRLGRDDLPIRNRQDHLAYWRPAETRKASGSSSWRPFSTSVTSARASGHGTPNATPLTGALLRWVLGRHPERVR